MTSTCLEIHKVPIMRESDMLVNLTYTYIKSRIKEQPSHAYIPTHQYGQTASKYASTTAALVCSSMVPPASGTVYRNAATVVSMG